MNRLKKNAGSGKTIIIICFSLILCISLINIFLVREIDQVSKETVALTKRIPDEPKAAQYQERQDSFPSEVSLPVEADNKDVVKIGDEQQKPIKTAVKKRIYEMPLDTDVLMQ